MKTTAKFAILLSVVIFLFLTAFVLYIHFENKRIDGFLQEQSVSRQKNFNKILELIGGPMETMAFDYTWWNEMVDFVESPDMGWAEVNLPTTLETFSVTDVWVYNAGYSRVYSVNDREDGSLKELPVPANTIPKLFRKGPFCHFYIYVPFGLMEIRGAFITTDDDSERLKEPRGYFFVGRMWTEERINEIAAVTDGNIRIVPFEVAVVEPDRSVSTAAISFQETLDGWDGSPVARLLFQSELEGFQGFNTLTRQLFFTFFIVLFLNLVIIIVFLRFWVVKPLKLITKALSSQDPKSLEVFPEKKNEFNEIAGLVKAFFIQKENLLMEISERQKAETALDEQKKRAEEYLNIVGVMVVSINAHRKVVLINKKGCEILGYERNEILGKDWFENFIPERIRKEAVGIFDKVIKNDSGRLEYYEGSVLCRDGKEKIIAWHNTLFKDVRGDVFSLGSGEDITQRKQAEQEREKLQAQLYQSVKMESIGNMANGIAQNFNNIFQNIHPLIEMTMAVMSQENSLRDNLGRVLRGIDEAKELSDKMLEFSREYEPKYKLTYLSPIVEEAFALFKMSLTSPVKLKLNITRQCGPVYADANDIKQVVMNLCNNAYSALEGKPGEIEIDLREIDIPFDRMSSFGKLKKGKYVRLKIRDTGIGMDSVTCSRIFEPFFTTKAIGKGTGLGLSVVHGIVRNHGGVITVESRLGEGTGFDVYFPVIDDLLAANED